MTVPFQARVARDLVVVEGPDATSFLQSLVSQDLEALAVGESGHSLLLQPQGKLLVDFMTSEEGQTILQRNAYVPALPRVPPEPPIVTPAQG